MPHQKRHSHGRPPNQSQGAQGPQGQSPQGPQGGQPDPEAAAPQGENAGVAAGEAGKPSGPPRETLRLNDLKDLSIQKLTQIAKDKNVAGATGMRKQDLIFQILKAQTEQSGFIFSEGVLEVLPD